jgi:hypothetical protein
MGSKPGRIPGPGRPKAVKNFSDEIRRDVDSACRRKAKETGKSFGDVLVELFWNTATKQPQLRLGAANIIKEILVIRETKSTIEKHEIGPRIGLPPIKQPDEDTIYPKMAPKGLMN